MMKTIKKITRFVVLVLLFISFLHCASTIKLEKESPIKFGEVYSKKWVAGVKGGGSGINIFINIESEGILLDSVYYRGKISKLQAKPGDNTLFIGRFLFTSNTNKVRLLDTPNKDKPDIKDFPFQLEDNECVVSYSYKGKINYFKLGNVIERQVDDYPMSLPPQKNKN